MASNKPQDPSLNAPDIDTSTGSAADVEAVMRKYDRESNTRIWEGTPKVIVSCILVAFSLFCLYVTLFANFLEQVRMTSFMGLVIIMGFLTYPARKGAVKPNSLPAKRVYAAFCRSRSSGSPGSRRRFRTRIMCPASPRVCRWPRPTGDYNRRSRRRCPAPPRTQRVRERTSFPASRG